MSKNNSSPRPLYTRVWFWILIGSIAIVLAFGAYCSATAMLDEYFAYMFYFSIGLSVLGFLWLLFYLIRKKGARIPLITLLSGIVLLIISSVGFYYSVPELSGGDNLTDSQRKNLDGYSKNELLESEKKESEEEDDDYTEYYSSEDDTEEYTSDSSDESDSSEDESSEKVSAEYRAALKSAKYYSNNMHMSKAGIYDQLVSEAGDKFPSDAAQYAVDHIKADWNENALKKARSYQEDMDMSTEAIRDQLTSDAGEKFTQEEADYAIQHLNN